MRFEVGDIQSLPESKGVRFDVGDHRVAVFRIGEDVYAIGDRCSHAEASLSEGEVFDCLVECPRHGSEFDLRTGQALSLPATKPVPVYPVSIEDGSVYLTLEEA
ncbi:MAG: bifunctional 3-phenylpropionate/cinnamic acid dioxygenase ferredoxin subunit [Acidimicrobiales bacterium]|nr:bifunctional 3-phenylpropionate/cinnamic acid dioxygenase ferredoxin subunit [Acidimicrobiales bacterium]